MPKLFQPINRYACLSAGLDPEKFEVVYSSTSVKVAVEDLDTTQYQITEVTLPEQVILVGFRKIDTKGPVEAYKVINFNDGDLT